MAQVRWTLKSDRLFDTYVFNAFLEYGQKTSKRWMQERIAFADLLQNILKHVPRKHYWQTGGDAIGVALL